MPYARTLGDSDKIADNRRPASRDPSDPETRSGRGHLQEAGAGREKDAYRAAAALGGDGEAEGGEAEGDHQNVH